MSAMGDYCTWLEELGRTDSEQSRELYIQHLANGDWRVKSPPAREAGMSLWQSRSGRLHWLRGCTGAGGRTRVRRVTVSREQLARAHEQGAVCRCLWRVEFTPGRKARDF